ncbi:RHS repeat-associated core domain-containing protein [Arcanobacterium pinnipediorum]|uniref:RHS repeat-associated core domain-containing protein n=1 Tax=Arcanobacterium pinnipediorum TaxID=1503041 RepID=A0ABY5AIW9_9ACTO|nr:RHS repeat-associated core domain-containing protein [Arcanobacterium pinnipediorum]USR79381.1 hypothetical protein NG665_08435 [Arcanobacterium pinnipediorum]
MHGRTTRTDIHVNALGFLDRVGDTDIEWDYGRPVYNLVGVDHQPFFSITGGIDLGIPGHTGSWGESSTIHLDNPYQITHHHLPSLPDGISVGSGSLHIGGLAWLGARVYDPTTHSFLTHDPLPPLPGVVWEANPFNYAANNPLSLSDPLGLKPVTDQELAAYNNNRSTSLWNKIEQNAFSWENLVGLAMIGLSGLALFTGIGLPVAGALFSAGVQIVAEKTFTGSVDWLGVGISTFAGLGAGAIVSRISPSITRSKIFGGVVKGAQEIFNGLSGVGKRVARFGVDYAGEMVEDGVAGVLEYNANNLLGRNNEHGFFGSITNEMFNPTNMLVRSVNSGLKVRGEDYFGSDYGNAGALFERAERKVLQPIKLRIGVTMLNMHVVRGLTDYPSVTDSLLPEIVIVDEVVR